MEGYIGEIRLFAGNFAPRHWEYCHGQMLPISNHSALFSIVGTTYGGDGRTTFALPDLRGRVPLGPGTAPGLTEHRLGQKGGSESNKLELNQLPVQSTGATAITKTRLRVATGSTSLKTEQLQSIHPNRVNNMQPWLGVNFIICVEGIFPSRS
jgi:microcystin-dependent protein